MRLKWMSILAAAGCVLSACGPWMRTLLGLPRPEGRLRPCTEQEERTVAAAQQQGEKPGEDWFRLAGRAVRGPNAITGAQIVVVKALRASSGRVVATEEAVLSVDTKTDGIFGGVVPWREPGVLVVVDVFEPRSTATLLLETFRDHCVIAEF